MLDRVDKRFTAVLTGDEVARLPADFVRDAISRRILVDAGSTSTVPRCVCREMHPDCVVDVDWPSGSPRGRCRVYGLPVDVTPEQVRRYRFDWEKWASWVRRQNGLDGAGPILGAGALFVGNGRVAGREFGLVVVAPSCRRAGDVIVPEGARQVDRPLVALLLGEPVERLPVDATVPAEALGSDLGTIDVATLELALDGVPQTITRSDTDYMLYWHEMPRGRRVDGREYDRRSRPEVRSTYDLFIDLPACAVWRKGRREQWVRDANERQTKKKLGPVAVSLLADYVRRPGVAMTAKETRTYRTSRTDGPSATRQLGVVRRSVRGTSFIRPGARSNKYGELPYLFEPGNMTWCLLERPHA